MCIKGLKRAIPEDGGGLQHCFSNTPSKQEKEYNIYSNMSLEDFRKNMPGE